MPRVPDASMATTFVRVSATATTDPVKKSSVYDAPIRQGYLIAVVRASDVGADITPTRSVLGIPEWKSPRFNGRFFVN